MKKLKKLLTLICVGTLVAIIGLLTACGGTTPTPDDGGKPDEGGNNTTPTTVTVTLDKPTLSLEVGQTGKLTVTVTGSEATPTVTSSKEATATATINGKEVTVTAVAKGNATITVTVGDKSAKCEVTVNEAVKPADDIELIYDDSAATYVMLEDDYKDNEDTEDLTTLELDVKYEGTETVTATTDKATVATAAYADGKVTLTAVGTGKTTLTVSAGAKTKSCTVEVGTFGLVYGMMEGEDNNAYMEVSGSALLTADNVYIPGYAYYEDYGDYLPVTRMKSPETNKDGGIVGGWAFQGADVEVTDEDGKTTKKQTGLPIKSVYVGDNMGNIAAGAFRFCRELESVKLGPAVLEINDYAFDNCNKLATFDWGESQVKNIKRVAFACCAFEEIDVPVSVGFLGDGVFTNSPNLKKAKINGPVTMLYGGTFQQCHKLVEIWLPAELETIANLAFYMPDVDNNWAEFDIDYDVTFHFAGKRSAWEKIHKEAAKEANTLLNSHMNPDHLTIICADDNDPKISLDKTALEVTLTDGAVTLTATTANLTGVAITVASSNEAAATATIDGNTITVTPVAVGTTTITATCGEVSATCEITVTNFAISTTNIMVGKGATAALNVSGDGTITAEVADTSIATVSYADGVATLTGVAYGKTKVTVSNGSSNRECVVWVGTAGLTYEADEDEDTPTYLIVSAGEEFDATELYIPGYGYYATGDVYLPVKTIKVGGFMKNTTITSVYTGDNVGPGISENAFNECTGIVSVKFGPLVTTIYRRAFQKCTALKTIDWGESHIVALNDGAFMESGLVDVTVPATVTFLGNSMFQDCVELKVCRILGQIDQLYGGTFWGDNKLEVVWFPKTLTKFGNLDFYLKDEGWNAIDITWETHIYFEGTQEQWDAIAGKDNNSDAFIAPEHNPNLQKHYNCNFEEMLAA